MIEIKSIKETDNIKSLILRSFIAKKITAMMNEYNTDDLEDIGYFTILDPTEHNMFPAPEMEFIEVIELGGEHFLHGVRILGDSYGEDLYLPIEVVRQ